MRVRIGGALLLLGLMLTPVGGAHGIEPGSAAPSCELTALGDRPGQDLQQLRGSVVLLDFWASWCRTCERVFPLLNELVRELGGRGLRVLGVNLDVDPSDALDFLARHAAEFDLAADPSGACPAAFGVEGMPTAYLIDRRGVVRFRIEGFRPGEARELRTLAEELLADPQDGS